MYKKVRKCVNVKRIVEAKLEKSVGKLWQKSEVFKFKQ